MLASLPDLGSLPGPYKGIVIRTMIEEIPRSSVSLVSDGVLGVVGIQDHPTDRANAKQHCCDSLTSVKASANERLCFMGREGPHRRRSRRLSTINSHAHTVLVYVHYVNRFHNSFCRLRYVIENSLHAYAARAALAATNDRTRMQSQRK